jgi:hypothetical protein
MRKRWKKVRWAVAGVVALSTAFAAVAFVRAQVRLTAPVPTPDLLVTPTLQPRGAPMPEDVPLPASEPQAPPLFRPPTTELTLPALAVLPVHHVESSLGNPFIAPVEGQLYEAPSVELPQSEAIGVGPTLYVQARRGGSPSVVLGAPVVQPEDTEAASSNPARLGAPGAGTSLPPQEPLPATGPPAPGAAPKDSAR